MEKIYKIMETFNSIADRYILANHILSFGQDICWRKKMCRLVEKNLKSSDVILDVACGTGENFKYCNTDFKTKIGLDPTRNMLEIAKKKFSDVLFIEGVAENLPFEDNSIDLITVSFGVRNFENRKKALNEFYRVLKKEGIVTVLEFFPMENGKLINKVAATYIYRFLPYVGGAITGNFNAYKYLSESIKHFIQPQIMKLEFEQSGLTIIDHRRIFPNIHIIIGKKL